MSSKLLESNSVLSMESGSYLLASGPKRSSQRDIQLRENGLLPWFINQAVTSTREEPSSFVLDRTST